MKLLVTFANYSKFKNEINKNKSQFIKPVQLAFKNSHMEQNRMGQGRGYVVDNGGG